MSDKVEIILPKSHTNYFTYKGASDLNIKPGDYVKVPFRGKLLSGICLKESNNNLPDSKIKIISAKISISPIQKKLLEFIEWTSSYSMYSLGDILRMVIPIDIESKIRIDYFYGLGDISIIKKNTKKRQELIEILMQGDVLTSILTKKGFDQAFLNKMEDNGLIKKILPNNNTLLEKFKVVNFPELSKTQENAVKNIEKFIESRKYQPVLLDGVTGSGKTEVYFSVIRNILLNTNGQVLILLPEIMLATQLIDRATKRFGFKPTIWHSSISNAYRKKNWHKIVNGQARIIIGARSALFLPFSNLSLIIVDEEHESSYKQEEGVIYHARDMAIARAHKENITIILASATPSLESLYNVRNKKFALINLPTRYSKVSLPEVEIVDMKSENLAKGKWISSKLTQELVNITSQNKQVMLFLNRRGYAPLTICRSCGYRFACNECSTCLVEHRTKNSLECHHCGYKIDKPKKCPECNEIENLVACGPGVERIAEEVQAINNDFKIAILTKDILSDINHAKGLIKDIEENQYNIIIGTQIIAKGLHFPHLIFVGIIDADLCFAGGDLRTSEKHFQLLNQLSGRAGREATRGKIMIQTYSPNNPIITALKDNNIENFINYEIKSREENKMPPYGKLASIILSSTDEVEVKKYAGEIVRQSPFHEKIRIFGPTTAILSKIRGKHRYRILVKADREINIQKYISFWFEKIVKNSKVKLKIDIDPYNFM